MSNTNPMIDHTQTLTLLMEEFPELKSEEPKQLTVGQVHVLARSFAQLTQQLIDYGDFRVVKICFGLADRLFTQGDTILRNAMENSFLYSLHLDWGGPYNQVARQMLPVTLKRANDQLINPQLGS